MLPALDILDCKPVVGRDAGVGADKPDNEPAAEEGSRRASSPVGGVVAADDDGDYKGSDKWLRESRKSCGDAGRQG